MLLQFNFQNFKSFKDEATLDLTATKMTEFSERVIAVGKEKVLPVAAIFGANASGKSNVYKAFEFMSYYVAFSFGLGGEKKAFFRERPAPFLFSEETETADTMFEVYFTLPEDATEKVYHYGFCIGAEGVTEEWLNTKAKTAKSFYPVFYRDESTLDLKGLGKKAQENIEAALEKQVLVISLGAKLRVSKCKQIRDWFLCNEFADFGDPVSSLFLHSQLPDDFVTDAKVRARVVKYFSAFDDSIKDFHVEEIPGEGSRPEKKHYKISAIHAKSDSDSYAEIPLEDESAGTLKMFALYPELEHVLESGGVYFIDELNARLHPLLVRNFVQTFLNPELNVHHAQLIFTTHDTWQLSNHLLRRDEIWFTEKDIRGASSLYSLADFVDEDGSRIRKDESYEKNYLLGKYGAIPSLKSLNLFEEG